MDPLQLSAQLREHSAFNPALWRHGDILWSFIARVFPPDEWFDLAETALYYGTFMCLN